MDAFDQGFEDYHQLEKPVNPYPVDTTEHTAWKTGLEFAAEEPDEPVELNMKYLFEYYIPLRGESVKITVETDRGRACAWADVGELIAQSPDGELVQTVELLED